MNFSADRRTNKIKKAMNKQAYIRPTMRMVKIQQQHIICTSPNGLDGKRLLMNSGNGNQIDEEEGVW